MNLNILDVLFLLLIGSFGLLSTMRGAIKELLSLLGLLGGFFAANWFYLSLGQQLAEMLADTAFSNLLAYVLIIAAGYLGGIFLSNLGDVFASRYSLLNRGVGGIIGTIKGIIFSLIIHWTIRSYIPPFQDELRESLVAGVLERILTFMEESNLI